MLSNMLQSFLKYERIRTTVAKAKVLRQIAEHCITVAKKNTLHAKRTVMKILKDRVLLTKLFTKIAPRYLQRPGGYVRILRLKNRCGDNSQMCFIELVEEKIPAQSTPQLSGVKSVIEKITKKKS